MDIIHRESSNTFIFKAGKRKKVHFYFLISDLSAFGNPSKKPIKIRGNYRKCMKLMLENELNELCIIFKDGDHFEIGNPVFTRGRTYVDVKKYHGACKDGSLKTEMPKIDLEITVPSGNAVRIFATDDNFTTYIVNDNGNFFRTDDFNVAEEISGAYF